MFRASPAKFEVRNISPWSGSHCEVGITRVMSDFFLQIEVL